MKERRHVYRSTITRDSRDLVGWVLIKVETRQSVSMMNVLEFDVTPPPAQVPLKRRKQKKVKTPADPKVKSLPAEGAGSSLRLWVSTSSGKYMYYLLALVIN